MSDWKDTLNLPRTDFPMKANLQSAEPEALARWEAMDLYAKIRESRKARRNSCFTTARRIQAVISIWERRSTRF